MLFIAPPAVDHLVTKIERLEEVPLSTLRQGQLFYPMRREVVEWRRNIGTCPRVTECLCPPIYDPKTGEWIVIHKR